MLQAEDEKWVTVYGLQGGDEPSILREFQKCGTIVQFGSGRDDRVNWTHIMYSVSPWKSKLDLQLAKEDK